MSTILITPETVAKFRKLVEHPEKCLDCYYKPIRECFEESEVCTPKHILFNQYIAYLRRPLPKVFFYIIMEEIYPELKGKAETGEFGYYLRCVVKKKG